MSQTIVVAGATGDLGMRIARALTRRGAAVRAIVRRESPVGRVAELLTHGAEISTVDYEQRADLTRACIGATCVVSALAGPDDAVVESEGRLVRGAVDAGCPRFIPSDFAIDFTKLPPGNNRFDVRRKLREHIDRAPIAATSIFNGAFTDLLIGPAPFILPRVRRVLYFGNAEQPLDFTTRDDTAAFTAEAALDPTTPRDLRIVGDRVTPRELAKIMTSLTGRRFRLLRGGGLRSLDALIRITHKLRPGRGEDFPKWQAMECMRDMFDGRGLLSPLDGDRYGNERWTSVRDTLEAHVQSQETGTELATEGA